jgi:hypothetical protein
MAGTKVPQSRFVTAWRHPLHHQLPNHPDETSIGADRSNAMQLNPKLLADPSHLLIEVIKHLHVVRYESDRLDQNIF